MTSDRLANRGRHHSETLHMTKLYILEATVPAGSPPPGLFQQSMGYVDENGKGIHSLRLPEFQLTRASILPSRGR
jgi:hypothetical protein